MAAQIRLLFLLVASILLSVGFTHPSLEISDNNEKISTNINTLFDMMLPTLQNVIVKDSLDPLQMSDIYKKLNGVITHNGVLDMTNGWLTGLVNMRRAGDVILSYENKALTLDMSLKFDVLDLKYNYFFRYGLIQRHGNFYGRLTNMNLQAAVSLDMLNYKLVIDSIKILDIENLSFKLEGHPLDPVLNTAIEGLVTIFKRKVMNTVEERCWKSFQSFVDAINEKLPRPDNQLQQYGIHDIYKNVNYVHL